MSNWLVSAAPRLAAPSIADSARSRPDRRRCFLQRVKTAADDHEKVVEIMRHAAGELAERVELLRFRQLRLHLLELDLGFAALGDVAGILAKPMILSPSRIGSMTTLAQKKVPSLRTRQPSSS